MVETENLPWAVTVLLGFLLELSTKTGVSLFRGQVDPEDTSQASVWTDSAKCCDAITGCMGRVGAGTANDVVLAKVDWKRVIGLGRWTEEAGRRMAERASPFKRKQSSYLSDTSKGRDVTNSGITKPKSLGPKSLSPKHFLAPLPCNSQSCITWPMNVLTGGFGVHTLKLPSTRKKWWTNNGLAGECWGCETSGDCILFWNSHRMGLECALSAWSSEHLPHILSEMEWAKFLINLHGARAAVRSRSSN